MTETKHPAAYVRADPARGQATIVAQRSAVLDLIAAQGWPEPTVYADEDRPEVSSDGETALAALTAAINAGRHDAVLLVGPRAIRGCPAHLLRRLLVNCSRHGVRVDYVIPPGPVR
jgi:DNA invertase Pin-like site-specific DNA recombinase